MDGHIHPIDGVAPGNSTATTTTATESLSPTHTTTSSSTSTKLLPPSPSSLNPTTTPTPTPTSLLNDIATAATHFFTTPQDHPDLLTLSTNLAQHIQKVSSTQIPFIQYPPTHSLEYYPLLECDYFTMCLFVLKRGVVMPIHDHPRMTVLSHVVSGSMRVKTYSLLEKNGHNSNSNNSSSNSNSNSKDSKTKARIHTDTIASANTPSSLLLIHPDQGPNLHSFTALSDTVVILDIIGPPYSDDRPCTYFRESGEDCNDGSTNSNNDNFCWLEVDDGPTYDCVEREWSGPPIVVYNVPPLPHHHFKHDLQYPSSHNL